MNYQPITLYKKTASENYFFTFAKLNSKNKIPIILQLCWCSPTDGERVPSEPQRLVLWRPRVAKTYLMSPLFAFVGRGRLKLPVTIWLPSGSLSVFFCFFWGRFLLHPTGPHADDLWQRDKRCEDAAGRSPPGRLLLKMPPRSEPNCGLEKLEHNTHTPTPTHRCVHTKLQ